jgi:hypothetical protein
MTVNVSKPAINVREKLAELDKPTGIAGEAMLRAETPQEQQALIGVGRRNVLINGGFDIWQRGTSVTATSYGYSTADRWSHNASGGTLSLSRQELTVGQTSVPVSLKYFYRLNATTGNNNAGLWQKVEGVDRVQGDITISFYAKGTNPAGGKFEIELGQYFGSTGSTQVNTTAEFSITPEWKRYVITLTLPSITGKTISGTGDHLRFYFRQPENDTTTTAWTLDFTGVQLELGKVATPFEHRSYGEELALCQRYYQQPYYGGTANSAGLSQSYGNWFHLPVTMRTTPTVNLLSGTNFFDYPGGNVNSADLRIEAIQYTASTVIRVKHIGNNSRIYFEGTTEADAEL